MTDHDAKVRAEELRGAAEDIDGEWGVGAAIPHPWIAIVRSWLNDRADQVAARATEEVLLCGQCGERLACMVKVGTADGWCGACLDEAAESDVGGAAKAWDEGMRTGTSRAMRYMSDEPNLPLASAADNPYLASEVPQ